MSEVCRELKIGDVVVLKSGGPYMTIESEQAERIACIWFAGAGLKRATFPWRVLQLVEKEAE